jgi:hypothetical protein
MYEMTPTPLLSGTAVSVGQSLELVSRYKDLWWLTETSSLIRESSHERLVFDTGIHGDGLSLGIEADALEETHI